jgi:hypothetical protein
MVDFRSHSPWRSPVALVVLLALCTAGCGWFSRSKPADPAPQAAPPPAVSPAPGPVPAVAPPPRPAGSRIADEAVLSLLVQGKTSKDEVRGLFGVPQEVVLSPGLETFIYYRDRTSGLWSRTPERVEMLTIRFDAAGILKDFEYRHSGK